MNIQHRQELLVGSLLDDAVPTEAGAIDNNVDRTEGFERGIHDLLRKIGLHQISTDDCDLPGIAHGCLRILQCVQIQVAYERIGAG